MRDRALFWGRFKSDLGPVVIGIYDDKVAWLSFPRGSEKGIPPTMDPWSIVEERTDIAQPFFKKTISSSPSLPVYLSGTSFQIEVWKALRAIPRGETATYAELAARIGRPQAARAVGSAVGANKIGYLVPCHRVIRGDGKIGEFRWGSELKQRMLDMEKSQVSIA